MRLGENHCSKAIFITCGGVLLGHAGLAWCVTAYSLVSVTRVLFSHDALLGAYQYTS